LYRLVLWVSRGIAAVQAALKCLRELPKSGYNIDKVRLV
jgi:hypothetical protein